MILPGLAKPSWRRSRYGFAFYYFLSLIAGWFALRLVLLLAYKPTGLSFSNDLSTFLARFERDIFGGSPSHLRELLVSATEQADEQRNYENCDKPIKKYLRNSCRGPGDASKTKYCRYNKGDQEYYSPS